MPALREVFAEYTIRFDRQRNLRRGNRAVSDTRNSLRRLRPAIAGAARALGGFAALAGGAAAAGLGRIVQTTTESMRVLERWSGRLGVGQDALQSWIGLGAEFGADIDDVTDALKEMQLKAQDAISGGTSQAEMFQRIGISLDDLRPVVNDADRLMELFVGRLGQAESQALRNFTVDELMSDAGTRMNQVFALGNTEIARRRAAVSTVLGPTAALSRAVVEHTRQVVSMSRRWEAFKREITLRILPVIDQVATRIGELVGPFRDAIRETDLLEGAFVALGVVGVAVAAATIGAWGPIAATVAAVGVAAAGVATAYDQVNRSIDNGDTALHRFLDDSERLGEGGTEGLVLLLGDAWDRLTDRLIRADAWLGRFYCNVWSHLEPVIDLFNELTAFADFGSVITGGWNAAVAGLGGAARERTREEHAPQERRDRRNRGLEEEESRLAREGGLYRDVFGERVSREAPVGREATTPREEWVTRLPPVDTPRRERVAGPVSIDAPTTVNLAIDRTSDDSTIARTVRREVDEARSGWISEVLSTHQSTEEED